MATNFPSSADSFTNPSPSDDMATVSHSSQHANVNDAVEAIETALLDGAPLHIDDANERVGIGKTNPSVLLDLEHATQANIHVNDSGGTIGGDTNARLSFLAGGGLAGQVGFLDTTDGTMTVQNSVGDIAVEIASAGDVTFNLYDGNVGIGTTSPISALDIYSTGTTAYVPTLNLTTTSSDAYNHAINAFNPNLTAGEGNILVVGKSASTKNSGYVGFQYSADGSDNNLISLGHWGRNWLLNVTGGGNVGIGTTSPAEKLDLVDGNLRVVNTVAGGEGAHIRLENKSSTSNTTAGIYFGVDGGSASPSDTGNAEILCINSGSSNKGILQFRVYDSADSEAMKIAGNGVDYGSAGGGGSTLRNGVAFANAGFAIDKGWASYPGIHVFHTNYYGDTNQSEFRVHGWNTSYASYPARTGSDFSVNFRIDGSTYSSSDRRHKTNIVDNPHGLSTVLQLQPRKFDRINSEGLIEENNTDILGFVAQEVIEVLPEAVNYYPDEDTPNENGWCRAYSLSESYIVSTLVNAVKELSVRIEALEAG